MAAGARDFVKESAKVDGSGAAVHDNLPRLRKWPEFGLRVVAVLVLGQRCGGVDVEKSVYWRKREGLSIWAAWCLLEESTRQELQTLAVVLGAIIGSWKNHMKEEIAPVN